MKINIGTKNKIKADALREITAEYDFLNKARVKTIETDSGVDDQPKSLEETVRGAKNRAKTAFGDCDFSVGVEDGLMSVGQAATGFMNLCVCAFYDGQRYYLGTSAAFEYPPKAIELVGKGRDINQAFYELGLTGDPKIGLSFGAIGILTKNRWCRKDTVKQSIIAALIQLDNKSLYE